MSANRDDDWIVYEDATGTIYEIPYPRSVVLAVREAWVAGHGYRAERRETAMRLAEQLGGESA